jgi:tetratricopeptide (TPR) repeat protein
LSESLNQQARAAMARRDAPAARAALARLVSQHPDYAPGWLTASMLELDLGQAVRALQSVDRGVALAPSDPPLLVQRVRCLHALGELPEARRAAVAAEAAVTADPRLQHELGNICILLGEHAQALRLLARAEAALPEDAGVAYNMAAALRFAGRFAEAEARLDRGIRLAPLEWEAYPTRSQLRRQTLENNHIAQLEAKLAKGIIGWNGNVHVRYALAKEYEDIGEYKKSFAHLAAGAALRRRNLRYDVVDDVTAMARIAATFGKEKLARAELVPGDDAAIFVFGLPRSGTTLVERILGCHPDVTSLGELTDFPSAVTSCAGGGAASKQDLIRQTAAAPPAQIGAAYLASVGRLPLGTKRFIDKLPINYLYAGLMAAALPGAKLVHVSRHPMANGYGMFKTLFQQGYPFSYDLDDLGRYIAAYSRLMVHWRDVLGDRMISVQYENLVDNQDAETRRLVDACGLPWDGACLSPQNNPAPSLTHSAVQVRQPVYREAVEQWRHYEAQLAPLAARLKVEGFDMAEEHGW